MAGPALGDSTIFDTVNTAAGWTHTFNDASAARRGATGIRMFRGPSASGQTGAWVEMRGSGAPLLQAAPNALATADLIGESAGDSKFAAARCYARIDESPTSGFFLWRPIALIYAPGGGDTVLAGFQIVGGTTTLTTRMTAFGANSNLTIALSKDTWYRFEVAAQYQADGQVMVTVMILAETGIIPLYYASAVGTLGGADCTKVRFGVWQPAAFTVPAGQSIDVDMVDMAVNDGLTVPGQEGIHNSWCWTGAVREFKQPSADGDNTGGASSTDWISTGTGTFETIDEWPPDDTNYRHAGTSGTPEDNWITVDPNLGGNKPKACVVLYRMDNSGGWPIYKGGVRVNGTNIEADMNQTAAWHYKGVVIGEKDGGGAWTAQKANDAQIHYRKTSDPDPSADGFIGAAAIEWEDDDGVIPFETAFAQWGGSIGVPPVNVSVVGY
jgi:hypothetical protein